MDTAAMPTPEATLEQLRAALRTAITGAGGVALPGASDAFLCAAASEVAEAFQAHRQVMKRCRDQFLFYEQQHRAKATPEADAKADVNREFAALCTAVLHGD